MFEGEAHRSYLALGRDLRLEREFEEGDWYLYDLPGDPGDKPALVTDNSLTGPRLARGRYVWLPLLHQWIGMLREVGVDAVVLVYDARWGWSAQIDRPVFPPAWTPTPEEAAARLWAVLTGRIPARQR